MSRLCECLDPSISPRYHSPLFVNRFTAEGPQVLEFTRDTWLCPLFTLHHLAAFEIHDLRDFEKQRLAVLQDEDGIRYCDLFNHFAPAFLATALALYESQTLPDVNLQRRGWSVTGGSQVYYPPVFAEIRKVPYDVHLCERLCDEQEGCLTFVFEDNRVDPPRCSLSKEHFKMGWPAENTVSGWRLDRISRMKKELDCDNLVTRKLADVERFQPLLDDAKQQRKLRQAAAADTAKKHDEGDSDGLGWHYINERDGEKQEKGFARER